MRTASNSALQQNVLSQPKQFYSIQTWHLFLFIAIGVLFNNWIINNFVLTKEAFVHIFSDRLELSRIEDLFSFNEKFKIWSMIGSPLILWISISFISLLIQFPLLLKLVNIPFKKLFRVLAVAQIPLLVAGFIKTIWLLQMESQSITEQVLSFMPLSLTNLIDVTAYSKPILGILGRVNVFEAVWILLVAKGISDTGKLKKFDAFLVVFCIWVILIACQWMIVVYMNKM